MPELGGDITNPQSLNRYAYALNNPTTLNDPSGMDPSGCTTQVDQNGNPYVSCSGADSVTVTASVGPSDALGAIGPGDPLLEAIWEMDSCDMWHNCDGLTSGPDSGGGTLAPRPAPPKPNIISWKQLQTLVHQNNESNFCDDVVDCIVFKESSGGGGFNANAVPPINPKTGLPKSSARGLMQVEKGAAADVANAYSGYPTGAALYQQLFNPGINIQVGSDYLDLLSERWGGLNGALSHYGPKGYASDIVNCVKELQGGNLSVAEAAAHGR